MVTYNCNNKILNYLTLKEFNYIIQLIDIYIYLLRWLEVNQYKYLIKNKNIFYNLYLNISQNNLLQLSTQNNYINNSNLLYLGIPYHYGYAVSTLPTSSVVNLLTKVYCFVALVFTLN